MLDPSWILLELLIGGVGYILFSYGRKQARTPQVVAGVLFMVYPLFVSSVIGLVLGGCLLLGGLWYAIQLGW